MQWVSPAWWALCCGIAMALIFKLVNAMWWRPTKISKQLKAQGFDGPAYSVLGLGNGLEIVRLMKRARTMTFPLSNEILPMALPYYHLWSKTYGRMLVFWFGTTPVICVDDPVTAKELLMNKHGDMGMLKLNPAVREVLGNGLLVLEGEKWARHRKIASPAFTLDNLKEIMGCISEKASSMVQRWEDEQRVEVDAFKEFKDLTAEIIGVTAFGSNPEQAKHVTGLLDELSAVGVEEYSFLPGYRFLPTQRRKRRVQLAKEVREYLMKMIEERRGGRREGRRELLGSMLEANERAGEGEGISTEEIMDECQTFFLAGHETTSVMLSWTMMLLSQNPDWQEQAREEVISVLGRNGCPTWTDISKLKIMGMIFNESMRLYPPAVGVVRRAMRDCKIGDLWLPEGTQVMVPMLAMNHDKSSWGEDAAEFNPSRFSGGGKTERMFTPFGYGPKACIGQSLALIEAKIALTTILRRFSFGLSPDYRHSPVVFITMSPQFGMPIKLHPLPV